MHWLEGVIVWFALSALLAPLIGHVIHKLNPIDED